MASKHPAAQRGISAIGLLIVGCLLAFVALIGFRVIPTFSEYMSIMKIAKNAAQQSETVAEVRKFFDLASSADYITSIRGSDLEVTKDGGRINVSFAYEKEIPIIEPVFLLIKYSGSTKDTYQ